MAKLPTRTGAIISRVRSICFIGSLVQALRSEDRMPEQFKFLIQDKTIDAFNLLYI